MPDQKETPRYHYHAEPIRCGVPGCPAQATMAITDDAEGCIVLGHYCDQHIEPMLHKMNRDL